MLKLPRITDCDTGETTLDIVQVPEGFSLQLKYLADAFDRYHSISVSPGDAVRMAAALVDDVDRKRPQIICLCGSSRFIQEMALFGWELEKGGAIVLSMHLLPQAPGIMPDHQAEAEGIAAQMDELHKRKIDLADRVIVLNIGGYIGESTAREIEYCKHRSKPVSYLEDEPKNVVFIRTARV